MRQLLGALLVVGALASCGGGGDDARDEGAAGVTSSTSTTEAGDGSTTTTTAAGDATTTTAAPGGGGGPSSPAPSGGGDAASSSSSTGDRFVPAGTYHYRQTGSATAGTQTYESPKEGTLVVDEPTGDRQTFHRYLDPNGEASDLVMQIEDGVSKLVETVVRQGGQEVRCTFDPPMPTVHAVGESSTGHGECGEVLDVDIEVKATGTTTVQLDGASHEALVTETITTTSGQLVSETRSLDHYLFDLGLPAHTETQSNGRFGTFTFSGKGTADLVSATPER